MLFVVERLACGRVGSVLGESSGRGEDDQRE
jgi:hypothetical protein